MFGEENSNFTLNLEEVDETKVGTFTAMPKGDYSCIVDECEFTTSQSSGSPMLVFKYKVVDNEEFEGRTLFHHCVLNKEFGIAMVKKIIKCTGVDCNLATFDPSAFADAGDIIGLPITVKVGIQTYQGEKRNNVKDVKIATDAASGNGFF